MSRHINLHSCNDVYVVVGSDSDLQNLKQQISQNLPPRPQETFPAVYIKHSKQTPFLSGEVLTGFRQAEMCFTVNGNSLISQIIQSDRGDRIGTQVPSGDIYYVWMIDDSSSLPQLDRQHSQCKKVAVEGGKFYHMKWPSGKDDFDFLQKPHLFINAKDSSDARIIAKSESDLQNLRQRIVQSRPMQQLSQNSLPQPPEIFHEVYIPRGQLQQSSPNPFNHCITPHTNRQDIPPNQFPPN